MEAGAREGAPHLSPLPCPGFRKIISPRSCQTYLTPEHESRALASFAHNEATIHDHNAGNWTFTLGHNAFSDMTFEEFQEKYMAGGMALFTNKAPKNIERLFLAGESTPMGYKAPATLDWVRDAA